MPYSQFTSIGKIKDAFGIHVLEETDFLPAIEPIQPSPTLSNFLQESLPLAATASEKARSEGIIFPVLLEVRRIQNHAISLFSGEDFTVDESLGLNGVVDFLLSRSPETLEIEAPVTVIVEAKKADLRTGLGQCMAEMIAAQKFNQTRQNPIQNVFGAVTSGTQWRFLQLKDATIRINLIDYSLPPVETILGILIWMSSEHAGYG